MNTENLTFVALIAEIQAEYGCKREAIIDLYEHTKYMAKGAKFAKIGDYSSDKSDHSEIADHLIILNFSYANMKKDDKETLDKFNVANVDVNRFNYDGIDRDGMSVEVFKEEVQKMLAQALSEIKNPSKKERKNNDIKLNDILVWNTETRRLSILAQEAKKTIIVEGEYKLVKSKPKTIAKKLIKKQANLRVDKYRRFAIDNLREVRLNGDVLEVQ